MGRADAAVASLSEWSAWPADGIFFKKGVLSCRCGICLDLLREASPTSLARSLASYDRCQGPLDERVEFFGSCTGDRQGHCSEQGAHPLCFRHSEKLETSLRAFRRYQSPQQLRGFSVHGFVQVSLLVFR